MDELQERLRFVIPTDPPLRHEKNPQTAVIRAAIDSHGHLLAATIVVGPSPLNRQKRRWIYKHVRFVSGTMTVRRLAPVFFAGQPRELSLAGETASVQFTPGNFMRERRP